MHSTLIDPATLALHLDDPAWVVLDIRHDLAQPEHWGHDQYLAMHVPGAVFLHVDKHLAVAKSGRNGRHPLPTPELAAELFGRAGIGPGTQVVAYDQNGGMFAARAWWMLRWLGHDAAAVLDGGFDRWVREGHRTTTSIPVPRATRFVATRILPTARVDEILASLPTRSLAMIDARVPERYRGEIEPLDPVAGHIPGARNRPYAQNLSPDMTFKDRTTLKSEFTTLLGDRPVDHVVHQCGSGVTACHNVLAMAAAGFPLTRLYPGSWSEWCADPSRPVATGEG